MIKLPDLLFHVDTERVNIQFFCHGTLTLLEIAQMKRQAKSLMKTCNFLVIIYAFNFLIQGLTAKALKIKDEVMSINRSS